MIVPLQMRIEPVQPESFDDTYARSLGLPSLADQPVGAHLAGLGVQHDDQQPVDDFYSMVDHDRGRDPRSGVGMITLSSVEENRRFLTELRDAIDGVLS